MKTKKTATKKASTKTAKTKAAKPARATAKADAKKLSQIEAALAVLAKTGEPMNCKAMVETHATIAGQSLLVVTPGSEPGGPTGILPVGAREPVLKTGGDASRL